MIEQAQNGGRPRIEFNLDELRKLRKLGVSDEEVAAFFECSVDTIARRKKDDPDFADAYYRGAAEGKTSLRRMQFKTANEGNASMLIWLGKVILEQKDTTRYEHTGANGGAITITHELTDEQLAIIATGGGAGASDTPEST